MNILYQDHIADIIHAIRTKQLVIVTHSSFSKLNQMGTAALRFETRSKKLLAIGWTRVPGDPPDIDAYHSGLVGL